MSLQAEAFRRRESRTGVEPAIFGFADRRLNQLGYLDIKLVLPEVHKICFTYGKNGSPDGSCTRFSMAENHSDLSIRPQGFGGDDEIRTRDFLFDRQAL